MNKNFLLVDDDDQNLYMLKVLVEGHGHNVSFAKNGAEALEVARQNPPDIIISDIMMPVMDGFELCRQWKSDDKLKDIIFIFYTATYTDKKDEEFALKLGADQFILKPADPIEFMEKVKHSLENSSKKQVVPDILEIQNDEDVFKLYNERLVNKLEKKMLELEREISERKKAEQELRESEKKYKTYVENAPHGIFIFDEHGHTTEANSMASAITGYSRNDLLHMSVYDLVSFEEKGTWDDLFETLLEKGISRKNGSYITKQGNAHFWNIDAVRITDRRFLCFVTDTTEKIQIEKEKKRVTALLHQSQKMESLGTLAGGIAHDFNNILSAIIGNLQLVMMQFDKENKDIIMEDLRIALDAAERATSLVKQILLFSRRESRERKAVVVNDILKETYKLLRSSLPASIELNQIVQDENVKVLADPTEIHQLVMNLCTNASHAVDEQHGIINIELKTSNENCSQDNISHAKCVLTISDNGHGIPDKIKNQIFDPFFTTKPTGSGTGLGLSVVHGIVESLGGEISVDSQLDSGTTFYISLPVIAVEDIELKSKQVSLPSGHETILYVDDEPSVTRFAKNLLTRLGYKVIAKHDGQEALATYKESPNNFQLVITDLTMPKMSGAELVKEIFKINDGQSIIITTGSIAETKSHLIQRSGVKHVMKKPFSVQVLAQTVRSSLDKIND